VRWPKKAFVNFALSVLSALLLIAIFPRFSFAWLAPVALTPLLIACARERSWKLRALNGWVAGFVFWSGVCYWIQFVLAVHGGLSVWLSWISFVLFAMFKGLHMAVFALLAGLAIRKSWAVPGLAALWTGIERTHGPLAFAWLDLGNAGADMPLLNRLAPWIGVYGLSFVFAMLASAVALVILRRPRRELAWLAALVVLLFLPSLPAPQAPRESVHVVQPNIDTEAEWTVASLQAEENDLTVLSHESGSGLIVWPEAPAPFYPSSPEFREFVGDIAARSNAYLLFGGVGHTPKEEPLNSAFLVNPSGRIAGQYDKVNLVPFGEFVPPPFGWINRITKEAGDFVPGNRIVVFDAGGRRIGAFICYESAFPDFVRQFPRDGAEVLVNLSNDGYFGRSAAREQHLLLARMRAVENRRWILRATNDGITAMIDPAGRITQRFPAYREIGGDMQFNYLSDTTPYTRHGDWFAWSCLIVGLAAAAAGSRAPMPNRL
jgi:apolipoprotein N-acyltransferase